MFNQLKAFSNLFSKIIDGKNLPSLPPIWTQPKVAKSTDVYHEAIHPFHYIDTLHCCMANFFYSCNFCPKSRWRQRWFILTVHWRQHRWWVWRGMWESSSCFWGLAHSSSDSSCLLSKEHSGSPVWPPVYNVTTPFVSRKQLFPALRWPSQLRPWVTRWTRRAVMVCNACYAATSLCLRGGRRGEGAYDGMLQALSCELKVAGGGPAPCDSHHGGPVAGKCQRRTTL